MKYLSIHVTTEAPFAIRSDHAAGGAAGIRYIPGTAFIGGLASLYRLHYHNKPKLDDFAALFLSEQVLYPDLYPAVFDDTGVQGRGNAPVYPLPKTARSCKRHTGFVFPKKDTNDAHGVRDSLIDWALFKLSSSSDKQGNLEILSQSKNCRRCDEEMDHFDGYYRRNDNITSQMIIAQVESYIRLQTHTGIHRESGTVQDGILYNRQVFEEGMQFWGQARFPDDGLLLERFETFIKEIYGKGMLHLGTGRTRGMGKVKLSVEEAGEKLVSFEAFSQRLSAFNTVFHERADKFGMNVPSYKYFFALTLHSPLLLCDDLLCYRSTIGVDILKEWLDCEVPELEPLYYSAGVRRVTGWQELWGTPRTSEYAIESGSVFLFGCSSLPDDTLLRALFALEEHGAGKRCAEGFGRICVSDQFHQQVNQEEALS